MNSSNASILCAVTARRQQHIFLRLLRDLTLPLDGTMCHYVGVEHTKCRPSIESNQIYIKRRNPHFTVESLVHLSRNISWIYTISQWFNIFNDIWHFCAYLIIKVMSIAIPFSCWCAIEKNLKKKCYSPRAKLYPDNCTGCDGTFNDIRQQREFLPLMRNARRIQHINACYRPLPNCCFCYSRGKKPQ